MVQQAPIEMLLGSALPLLGAQIADMAAGRNLQLSDLMGFFNGQSTLARDQFTAARDAAERNYQLDLRRFGLDEAELRFQQRLAEASLKLESMALLSSQRGPENYLAYNHTLNGLDAPEGTAADPFNLAGGLGGDGGGTNLLETTFPDGSKGFVNLMTGGISGGSTGDAGRASGVMPSAAAGSTPAPAPAQSGPAAAPTQPVPQPPSQTGSAPNWQQEAQRLAGLGYNIPTGSQYQWPGAVTSGPVTRAAQPAASVAPMPVRAPGIAVPPAPIAAAVPDMGAIERPPPIRYSGDAVEPPRPLPRYAEGGAQQGGMAIVGDAPEGESGGHPELVVSAGPFAVMPFDGEMPEGIRKMATGGIEGFQTFNPQQIASAPFMKKLTGQMDPGAWGNFAGNTTLPGTNTQFNPFDLNLASWTRMAPSEQGMAQGTIETPRRMGGLGLDFADVIANMLRGAPRGRGAPMSAAYG